MFVLDLSMEFAFDKYFISNSVITISQKTLPPHNFELNIVTSLLGLGPPPRLPPSPPTPLKDTTISGKTNFTENCAGLLNVERNA